MQNFFDKLTEINDAINGFIWVKIGLVLLIGTGIIMTCVTRFSQISHLKTWWKATIGGIFTKEGGAKKKNQPPDDVAVSGVMYGARGNDKVRVISRAFRRQYASADPARCSGCGSRRSSE